MDERGPSWSHFRIALAVRTGAPQRVPGQLPEGQNAARQASKRDASGVGLEPGCCPAVDEQNLAQHRPARTGLHRDWVEGHHEFHHRGVRAASRAYSIHL